MSLPSCFSQVLLSLGLISPVMAGKFDLEVSMMIDETSAVKVTLHWEVAGKHREMWYYDGLTPRGRGPRGP